MLDENNKKLLLFTLLGKNPLQNFEKYIYNFSLEEWEKIFGDEIFLELLEYDYFHNIIDENFEKICLKILDISDILAEYLIFLMEKFLQKNDDFDKIFEELYEYYVGGLSFLSPFEAYSYLWGSWDFEIDENNALIDEIFQKIPEIIKNLRNGKFYNLTFDDVDFQKYKFISGSIFSPFSRRFTYQEK